jgi:hypothetical protein
MADRKVPAWKADWTDLTNKTHTEQAVWFMNGFWDEDKNDAERIWDYVHAMIEIHCDSQKTYGSLTWEGKEGNDLDQFKSHRFLEKFGETLTVKKLAAELKKIDIDNNKRMCMSEYLLFKYGKTGEQVANAPQGGGSPEKYDAAKKSFNNARIALQDAIAKKTELQTALAALEKEEKAYNDAITKLENKKTDTRLSTTKRNSAAVQLDMLKSEDPMPLRKAKITSSAAIRKSKKAEKKAKKEFDAAKAQFDALKKTGGVAYGEIWWMERELAEIQKDAPGGKKKRKADSKEGKR